MQVKDSTKNKQFDFHLNVPLNRHTSEVRAAAKTEPCSLLLCLITANAMIYRATPFVIKGPYGNKLGLFIRKLVFA